MHSFLNLTSTGLLLLLLSVLGNHALTTPPNSTLECYACADCPKVDENTPIVLCNEEYFLGTTETTPTTTTETTSTSTTTESDTTTDTTRTTTSTETPTTVEEITTEAVPETTSENTTTSTTTGKPTPPTVAPVETTSGVPTPPNPGTVLMGIALNFTTTTTTSTPNPLGEVVFAQNRRRRALGDFTYHCYTIQVNNTSGNITTDRGCERVAPEDGVCTVLNRTMVNEDETINKCVPCTMPLCNGAVRVSLISALGIAALLAIVRLC